jgi:SCY1-like protein 1
VQFLQSTCFSNIIFYFLCNISFSNFTGFSDSNSKLREDTLKSLVDVVEKLDEGQLQDKLVRCICNLQNDAEASVRTNSVIFLSRIASKLTSAVRHRVLTASYCKAMRDPFVHCRCVEQDCMQ